MIKLNTPFIEFYKLIEETACKESGALEYLEQFIGKTMGEAIDALPEDSRESWSVWALRTYCDVLGDGARKHIIAHVEDPMAAFIVYLRIRELSDADDAILRSKFEGKLPRAERELADVLNTSVVRRKVITDVSDRL